VWSLRAESAPLGAAVRASQPPALAVVANTIAAGLFCLAITLYMALSAPLMTVLGIPYDAPTGSFVFKLHVGTHIMLLAFVIAHLGRGNVAGSILASLRAAPGLGVYLGTDLLLLAYSIARYGPSGSAFIIETLMMPAICALLLSMFEGRALRLIFVLIVGLTVVNALIGIAESLTHHRLVPLTVAGGVVLKEDIFRSSALLGHPLTDALVTGPLVIVTLALPMRVVPRLALLSVLMLGLLSFGGRASFLATSAMLAFYYWAAASTRLVRGELTYLEITGGAVVLLALAAGVAGVIVVSGIGERIFVHMTWDHSANIRLRIWQALDLMSASDIMFGISPLEIRTITYRLGLIYPLETIENFWLLMLMQMGVVGLIPFITGLAAGCRHLWRRNGAAGRLSLVLFIAVASSNNSLASKTSALTLLFSWLTCAAIYRRRPPSRVLAWR
jgi:hypothetical protein